MKYMLDTNICIYIIAKRPESVLENLKAKMDDGFSISAITLAELEYGVAQSEKKEKNADALAQFLAFISIFPFDEAAAAEYGWIHTDLRKKGTPIGPMDELIAAHAKSQGLILVTNNTREFERVVDLKLENWV